MGPRIQKLASRLEEAGVDAFFAWTPVAMGYLSGLFEGAHERFLALGVRSNGDVHLICPALTETKARSLGIESVRSWTDTQDPVALFSDLAKNWGLKSGVVAVDDFMPSKMLLQMQSVLPAALFQSGQAILGSVMARKEPEELELMRRAASIADRALPFGLAAIRPGATERHVATALRGAMSELGGEPTFCIVATGANGAEPHHETDDTPISPGDVVVMDFGCSYKGYQSDITRMACCGRASEEAQKVHDLVFAAHMAGRTAIHPGVAAAAVDQAARKVIEDGGYGERFVHRLGHGIGMSVHEEPYINGANDESLEVGNCFSIEPGIYLPGRFGVRIENIVTCTETGHESLNAEPSAHLTEVG